MKFSNGVFYASYDSFELKFYENPYHLLMEQLQYNKVYTLTKGDTVIDAGAFMGTFSLYASKTVGRNGHVFVFEPDDKNWNLLQKHILLNETTNITCFKKGLWNKETSLYFSNNGSIGSSISSSKTDKMIDTISLDKFISSNRIEKIDFIKMDIEGAEIEALEGAEKLLAKGTRFSIASYHIVNSQPTYLSLENTFKNKKYKVLTNKVPELVTHASPIF